MILFPTLAWQSSNRFYCIVCILVGLRHQLQGWKMLEKLAWLFSLHLSVCVLVQLRESERFTVGMYCFCLPLSLSVCRANTETE